MHRISTVRLAALTLLSGLVISGGAESRAARDGEHQHYKLVDMGTFGGPSSYLTLDAQVLNERQTVAGGADTTTSDPYPDFCFNSDCFVSHAFQWQKGGLTDLGTLPGGSSSQAVAIATSGFIVGDSQNGEIDSLLSGFPERRGVLWNKGQIHDLGTFGGNESVAFGVNNRGQAAGAAVNTIADPYSMIDLFFYGSSNGTQARAFLWQNGKKQDLGTLGTGNDAVAIFVNDAGQVAGMAYTNNVVNQTTGYPTFDPFLWDKKTGMRDLGSFGGTQVWTISDLNQRGEVVGALTLPGEASFHPFLWNGTKLVDLGTFGGNFGIANWINDAGIVVGYASYAGDQVYHAAIWKNGTITDLGVLPGDTYSEAQGINSKGELVGVSAGDEGWNAVRWENGQIVDLHVPIVPDSFVYINERGEITAEALQANGDEHAVLLIPCDDNHAGIKGCDYSPVDVNTAKSMPPTAPARNQRDAVMRFVASTRPFGGSLMFANHRLPRAFHTTN